MSPAPSPEPAVSLPPSLAAWALAVVAAVVAAAVLGQPVSPQARGSNAAFDLERDLATAEVAVVRGGTSSACAWQAGDGRFRCGDEPWAFVGPYGGTSQGAAWRCTWAHPVAAGAATQLRWPAARVGRELHVRLGLVDGAPEGAPVRLKVWLNQEQIAELSARSSDELVQLDRVLSAGGDRGELRVELSASDHALRMACFDLRLRGQRPAKAGGGEGE